MSCRNLTRRDFLGGAIPASLAFAIWPAWAKAGEPLLRFGAASDVHMRRPHPIFPWFKGSHDNNVYLEKALRWFDAMRADAVVFPGDIADLGLIPQLEQFADTWNRVFPHCRAKDGRPVARIAVTGNHDIGQWPGLWDGKSEELQRKWRFDFGDNLQKTWRRIFDEEWSLVSRHEVKGITFVGAQYMRLKPPVERYFKEHADEFDPAKPFFYVQHVHPEGTCFGDEKRGLWDVEMKGQVVRALSRFPKAVALSGHSHNSVADDRSVWQGTFTSVNCGSTWGAGLVYCGYDNALAPFLPGYGDQRQEWLVPMENAGRCCLMFDVWADHLVVHRWCVATDEQLGEDWVIPLPATVGGPFDFARALTERRRGGRAPQFARGAKIKVDLPRKPISTVGKKLKGRSVVRVTFPCAKTVEGTRVFDYQVEGLVDGKVVARSTVLASGFYLPERRSHLDGVVLFARDEFPLGRPVIFRVTPRDCYHSPGRALVGAPIAI